MTVPEGVDLASRSANMISNSSNVKLSFLTSRCDYWGLDLPVDLPLHLPIWPLNSRNVKSQFLNTRTQYQGESDLPLVDLPKCALTVEMWNCHSWPLDATTGGVDLPYWRSRSATWSANMCSNSRNVKLPFLTTRCHYWGVDLSVDLPLDLPMSALTQMK